MFQLKDAVMVWEVAMLTYGWIFQLFDSLYWNVWQAVRSLQTEV